MSIRAALVLTTTVTLAAGASLLSGCHRPHGAIMSSTGGSATYYSTEMEPKTLHLVDLRTSETVFAMDIPVGKQLTIQFHRGDGDDPVYSPDLMTYEVFDLGTSYGKLRNALSVPNANCRRLDVSLREGPEYMTASPDLGLRTDQMRDRPEWWTPEGGELPEDQRGVTNYDD